MRSHASLGWEGGGGKNCGKGSMHDAKMVINVLAEGLITPTNFDTIGGHLRT